jgi:hypothetical protein
MRLAREKRKLGHEELGPRVMSGYEEQPRMTLIARMRPAKLSAPSAKSAVQRFEDCKNRVRGNVGVIHGEPDHGLA